MIKKSLRKFQIRKKTQTNASQGPPGALQGTSTSKNPTRISAQLDLGTSGTNFRASGTDFRTSGTDFGASGTGLDVSGTDFRAPEARSWPLMRIPAHSREFLPILAKPNAIIRMNLFA